LNSPLGRHTSSSETPRGYQRNAVPERIETMPNPAPVIGEWYRRAGGDSFEVVAIDRDDRTIEIQYFDGTIEELDLEEWLEDPIQPTEPPEDWTGSVDVEPEDTENEYEAEPGGNSQWGDPLGSLDRGEIGGYSEIELSEYLDDADRL
jgi:Family of unknown function (DUF6763)